MPHYSCPFDAIHRAWDNSLSPALTIEPGDTVTFSTVDSADSTIPAPDWAKPQPSSARLGVFPSIRRAHPISGPIAVRSVEPGDTLVIEVLAIEPADWGFTTVSTNGLLGAEFGARHLMYWDLRGDSAVPWKSGADKKIRVPIQPFCGVIGVASAEPGELSTVPPRAVGGNLDVRHLVPGSVLYLPAAVSGALFSVGDVHAAQGDGEVCGTGIECRSTVTLRFNTRRGRRLDGPEFHTPKAETPAPLYGVAGVAPDLMEASRQAVRRMIDYLVEEHGLSALDAYILCSVAVDLEISEVVDPPNWVVSAVLPLSILS